MVIVVEAVGTGEVCVLAAYLLCLFVHLVDEHIHSLLCGESFIACDYPARNGSGAVRSVISRGEHYCVQHHLSVKLTAHIEICKTGAGLYQ